MRSCFTPRRVRNVPCCNFSKRIWAVETRCRDQRVWKCSDIIGDASRYKIEPDQNINSLACWQCDFCVSNVHVDSLSSSNFLLQNWELWSLPGVVGRSCIVILYSSQYANAAAVQFAEANVRSTYCNATCLRLEAEENPITKHARTRG